MGVLRGSLLEFSSRRHASASALVSLLLFFSWPLQNDLVGRVSDARCCCARYTAGGQDAPLTCYGRGELVTFTFLRFL